MKNLTVCVLLMGTVGLVTGCTEEKKTTAPKAAPKAVSGKPVASGPKKGQKPAGHPPRGESHGKSAAALSGKVLETMDAGGYSYIKLKSSKGEVWAAVKKTTVKVGSTIRIGSPMLMQNFKSKTLERTFAQIYFGQMAAAGKPASHASMVHGSNKRPPHGDGKAAVAAAHKGKGPKQMDVDKVAKVKGGYTVAELFAKRKELSQKKVAVRGKVTKFNSGIMGRNWLHIQDGTGSVADKSFDLTVTTQASAKVGDLVVVEGVLAVDRNFGAGYAYPAILEKASIKK